MWLQITNPTGNLAFSTLIASLPVLILFYALAVRRMHGHKAVALTLLTAVLVAVIAYGMPVKLALLSTLYGIMTGLFPLGWLVLCAVFLYNLTVKTGQFEIVKDSISSITEDRRIQALLIAYSFGAFIEGAAGQGAPVAITAGMLVGLGFNPFYAAVICLIANVAPVAFGGVGIPIIIAGKVTALDPVIISKMIACQLPLLAFIDPFWLIAIMSGWRGTKEVAPAILVTGGSFSVTMYLVSAKMGPELTAIISSLVSIVSLTVFLKFWRPRTIWRFPNEPMVALNRKKHSTGAIIKAWSPFIVLTVIIGDWGINSIKSILDQVAMHITIYGLDKAILVGNKPIDVVYHFNWLSSAGTAILIASVVSAVFLRVRVRHYIEFFSETLKSLRFPLITIASMLGFAYLSNYSGITTTLAHALAVTGGFIPFMSPFLGWLGVFITGSVASSNALFCKMQQIAAEQIGVNPVLTITSNASGGVAGKMISPQSIAVACASVNLIGKEGDLFRYTFKHSVIFTAIMGIVTYVQAYFLRWMIPAPVFLSNDFSQKMTISTQSGIVILFATVISLLLLGLYIARQHSTDISGPLSPSGR